MASYSKLVLGNTHSYLLEKLFSSLFDIKVNINMTSLSCIVETDAHT